MTLNPADAEPTLNQGGTASGLNDVKSNRLSQLTLNPTLNPRWTLPTLNPRPPLGGGTASGFSVGRLEIPPTLQHGQLPSNLGHMAGRPLDQGSTYLRHRRSCYVTLVGA